jgi:hypothetical protein
MLRPRLFSHTFDLDRAARVLSIVREELAFRLLDEDGWLELSRRMYERSNKYQDGSAHNESGLFAFERHALERFFPAPPASLLVGACGGGREIFGLLALGYRIAAAYDPVDHFIHALRRDPRLADTRGSLCVGPHQGVATMPITSDLHRRRVQVEGVIVGWASYTHLLRAERRIQFLRSIRSICPRGPVLLSFFVDEGTTEDERPRRLRANVRRWLRTTPSQVEAGDALHRGTGGVHYFTQAAFSAEATLAGYQVLHFQEHDFAAAHAVLSPQSPG